MGRDWSEAGCVYTIIRSLRPVDNYGMYFGDAEGLERSNRAYQVKTHGYYM